MKKNNMLIFVLSMHNHKILNVGPHYQVWRKFTKRTMDQVNFQCSYVMLLQQNHGNLVNQVWCKSIIHIFKVMHIHLKVIGTHPFLGNIGHLYPKTNLGTRLARNLSNILNIFLNIIPTIHLHHNQNHNQIHLKYPLPLNYMCHHFQTHTLK